ncbi:MAG: hypothetical protein ACK5DJ_11080, partial [Bacteroidota bacterium]
DSTITLNLTITNTTSPTISGSSYICPSGTVTLSAPSGFNSYSWSNGATSQTIVVSAAGTFTVTVSTSQCTTSSNAFVVTLDNSTVASMSPNGNLTSCANDSIMLSAVANPNFTYLWNTGQTSQIIYATNFQSYVVTVTNSVTGCSSTTSPNGTTIQNTLASDLNQNEVTNVDDFLILLSQFGATCPCSGDLNGSNSVNVDDFLILLGQFNSICN